MQFWLSSSNPLNTVFTDEEGQPFYKVTTPFKLFGDKTTTISRVIKAGSISSKGSKALDNSDNYSTLADITWRNDATSKLRYQDKEMEVGEYFRKGKQGWRGKDRVFTGPDGQEYRWYLSANSAELKLQDDVRTPVAKYYPEQSAIIKKSRRASLEVFPDGEHILDTIIVSFVYAEKLRKDRERDARAGVGDMVLGTEDE